MGKKDCLPRCILAINRDRERNGLPPVQVEKVFVSWETKPSRHVLSILTSEGELIRFAHRRKGPVVRLTWSMLIWPDSPRHGDELTFDDTLAVEYGHDLDGNDLDALPTASGKRAQS